MDVYFRWCGQILPIQSIDCYTKEATNMERLLVMDGYKIQRDGPWYYLYMLYVYTYVCMYIAWMCVCMFVHMHVCTYHAAWQCLVGTMIAWRAGYDLESSLGILLGHLTVLSGISKPKCTYLKFLKGFLLVVSPSLLVSCNHKLVPYFFDGNW